MCIAHKHLKYAPIIIPSTYKELGEPFCTVIFQIFGYTHKKQHLQLCMLQVL